MKGHVYDKHPGGDPSAFSLKLMRITIPSDWEEKSIYDDGYCYLCLYPSAYHQKVALLLGSYPQWSSVKALGGFRSSSCYQVHRLNNGTIHIGANGIGTPAEHLRIGPNEVVGAHERGDYWTARNKAYAFTFFAFYWFVGHYILTRIACAFIMWSIMYPAGLARLMIGEIVVPTPLYLKWMWDVFWFDMRAYYRKYRTIFGMLMSNIISSFDTECKFPRSKLIFFAICMCIVPASGKFYYDFEKVVSIFDPALTQNEQAVIKSVHDQYISELTDELPNLSLCISSVDLRYEVLGLDLEDDILDAYVAYMCPQLETSDGWRRKAELATRRELRSLGDKVDRAVTRVQQMSSNGADKATDVVEVATNGLDKVVDRGVKTANEVLDTSVDVYDHVRADAINATSDVLTSTADVLKKTIDKTVELVNKHQADPGKAIEEVVATADNMLSKLFKPNAVFSYFYNRSYDIVDETNTNLPSARKVAGKSTRAVTRVSGDLEQGAVALYNYSIDAIVEHFKDMREKSLWEVLRNNSASLWDYSGLWLELGLQTAENITETVSVEKRAVKLVDGVPWLAETMGKTIGSLVGGFANTSGVSNINAKNIKETRQAVFGDWSQFSVFSETVGLARGFGNGVNDAVFWYGFGKSLDHIIPICLFIIVVFFTMIIVGGPMRRAG